MKSNWTACQAPQLCQVRYHDSPGRSTVGWSRCCATCYLKKPDQIVSGDYHNLLISALAIFQWLFAHMVTICASYSDGNITLIQDFCFHNCASFLTKSLAHFLSQILFLCQDLLPQVPIPKSSLFPEVEVQTSNRVKLVIFFRGKKTKHPQCCSAISMFQKIYLHEWCRASKSGNCA